jgi:putative ABC transport system permease protein
MGSEIVHILQHVLLQGLIYSFVVMGVYLSSRVIKFDDLTTEGGFGFGGAITALLIISGLSPWLALPIAMLGGALAGSITGLLHTKMKMNNLISGLVVTTALFSICLKLATSNLALPESSSIFPVSPLLSICYLIALVTIAYFGIRRLLRSELGLLFTAVGSNPQIVTSLGKSVDHYKIGGLAIANSLTALAGALFVQWSGFFSITGNVGTLVTGIAGLILAEMVRPRFGLNLVLGGILYQALFAITIEFELQPIWNNLIKALLIVVLIQLNPRKKEASLR